jgi:hypothetical protein
MLLTFASRHRTPHTQSTHPHGIASHPCLCSWLACPLPCQHKEGCMVEPREQCDMQHHAAMCVCVGGGGGSVELAIARDGMWDPTCGSFVELAIAQKCGTRHVLVHFSSLPLPTMECGTRHVLVHLSNHSPHLAHLTCQHTQGARLVSVTRTQSVWCASSSSECVTLDIEVSCHAMSV